MPPARPAPPAIPRLAVIGAEGFLGRRLLAAARAARPGAVGTSRRPQAGLLPLDLARPDLDPAFGATGGPTVAVIAAGVTRVDRCQRDPDGTAAVNVHGTLRLAASLAARGIRPIFLSSDRVFDGREGAPFDETARPEAASVYGRQKLAVERALLDACPGALVVRLSKLYGPARGDGGLFDAMADRLAAGRPVDPPYDQFFNPTSVADAVEAILHLAAAGTAGIVHACAEPPCGRRELGLRLAGLLGADPALVPPPPGPALRTALVAGRLGAETGLTPLTPLEGLARFAVSCGATA